MRPYILQSTIFKYPYPFFGSEMTRRHQNLLARSWRLGDHPARFNSLRNLWPTNVGACLCSPHPHPNKHLFWQPSEAKLSSCPPIWLPFSLPSSFNTFIYWIALNVWTLVGNRRQKRQKKGYLKKISPKSLKLYQTNSPSHCFSVFTLHIQIDLETAVACQTFESSWDHLGFLRHGNIDLGVFLGWGQMKCSTGGRVCFVYTSKPGCFC